MEKEGKVGKAMQDKEELILEYQNHIETKQNQSKKGAQEMQD